MSCRQQLLLPQPRTSIHAKTYCIMVPKSFRKPPQGIVQGSRRVQVKIAATAGPLHHRANNRASSIRYATIRGAVRCTTILHGLPCLSPSESYECQQGWPATACRGEWPEGVLGEVASYNSKSGGQHVCVNEILARKFQMNSKILAVSARASDFQSRASSAQ